MFHPPTPYFSFFILIMGLLLLGATTCSHADEDTTVTVTPYVSLGAYYRDCNTTDWMLCSSDKYGSNMPGTIDAGLRFAFNRPTWALAWAHEIDIGWHHQSYVNRGVLIPGVLDFGGQETHIDMYGVRFTWHITSLSFKFSF